MLCVASLQGGFFMKYLICYDISGDKNRRRVARFLESCAYRLQYSVFVASCSSLQIEAIKEKIFGIIGNTGNSILTIIPLCHSCEEKIWQYGEPVETPVPYVIA